MAKVPARAKHGDSVVVLVIGKGAPRIKGGEPGRVSKNAMPPFQRNKAGFAWKVRLGGGRKGK